MKKTIVAFIVFTFILCINNIYAQNDSIVSDSTIVKKNIFGKIIDYFSKSNEVNENKRFDFSIIGGPHYSSETKLGLGLAASGLYRIDPHDLSISPSNVSLYGDITTSGFYMIGIKGNTIFPKEKFRIDADLSFSSFPSKYWGIGYESGKQDEYSKYTADEIQVKADFLARTAKNLYIGISGNFRNVVGNDFKDISFLNGAKKTNTAVGLGIIASYDSRDFIPNPYKGIYLKFEQLFHPEFLGSTYSFNKTEFIARYYIKAWNGAVLAFDLNGIFNTSDTPWSMLALMGNSRQMRGYYEGRYRDRNLIQAQAEVRQHIYKRSGAVVWVGAGNVFSKFGDFEFSHTLPNFGIGYRWEFKNRVNLRLDYGFGKGQSAFYFNINEAF